MIQKNASIIGK